jgi:hypothetical protein
MNKIKLKKSDEQSIHHSGSLYKVIDQDTIFMLVYLEEACIWSMVDLSYGKGSKHDAVKEKIIQGYKFIGEDMTIEIK